ncbi:hypothetical protein PIB30_066489 [Stylosanthes scabra]|uniref:Uncharacterized protein n=1 Tax=Stylosanthes scabra TaxID=79078 RepID=A0ABU6QPB5_9FABA|nr:hypothetical protein [Stylosanthes scabra]
MKLTAVELALAAYIFGEGLDPREVLFTAERAQGDREALWSLRLKHEVFEDVLNLVAITLKFEHDEATWWLPPTFAHIALNTLHHCNEMLDFITSRFMGYVVDLKKIYALSKRITTAS